MILLITGIMAAGKSSVAQAIAERLPKSVHLRGDMFRRMIVGGRVDMGDKDEMEARAQLNSRYRAAVGVAKTYHSAGFDVIYQDVMIGPVLNDVVTQLSDLPLYVVVLCPRREVVEERERSRSKTGYGHYSVADLDQVLNERTARIGLWLDNSDQTVEQTADAILASLDAAKV